MSSRDSLTVFISDTPCGTLHEDRNGTLSFTYLEGYHGIPLSLSMPVSPASYGDKVVRPYLMGVLPDDPYTRSAIAAPYGISGDNPYRLARVIGRDCPGAVRIVEESPQGAPRIQTESTGTRRLSNRDIEQKLASIREDASRAWTDLSDPAEGHWSLAGCQAKFALLKRGDSWFECQGDTPSTHIFKPGVEAYRGQALCEHLCMQCASKIGLPTADTEFKSFGNEPAIIVERYDRIALGDESILRIHQEDLCQALSVSPLVKYAEQGGPSTPNIIGMLRRTGANARENIYQFVLDLFFNYLIGATDAHAKNHSIVFLSPSNIRLAPLYDVASVAPYRSLHPTQRKPLRAALSIGGENRFGMLRANHIEKMVHEMHLGELDISCELLVDRLIEMAEAIPDALSDEVNRARKLNAFGIDEIGTRLLDEVAGHCHAILKNFGRCHSNGSAQK